MTEILAVFRSRSQAMDCYTKMRAYNVPSSLINTPKEAGVGCGLSVKFPNNAATYAKRLIARLNYSSFYGYLKLDDRRGNINVKRY